jgi:hypothetical protein
LRDNRGVRAVNYSRSDLNHHIHVENSIDFHWMFKLAGSAADT